MWFYKGAVVADLIEGFESFVYLIERLNLIEDSKSPIYYVGKKNFYTRRKVKGKTVLCESNWQNYFGSCDPLNADIEKYGAHNFRREILHFCRTAGDSGYMEIREQIDRQVLFIDGDGYKMYYNGNINGRYHSQPDIFELNEDLKLYLTSVYATGNNRGKLWINNGEINKIVKAKEASASVGNKGWVYGKIKPKIAVNDGITNLYIDTLDDINDYTLGHITKRVTNGFNNKLIPIHQLDEFLAENGGWYIGFSGNDNMVWITNGVEDLKILASDISLYPDYKPGRTNIPVRGKIAVFKDTEYKFIFKDEYESYEQDGWVHGRGFKQGNRYHVNNGLEQKYFSTEEDRSIFLDKNPYWYNGQLKRDNFNTNDKVFAINMETGEKVCVSRETYKNNPLLTGVSSKKVKVKKKNRIIFEGYAALFFYKFGLPELPFMNACRGDGFVKVARGKNMFLNEEKYFIQWVK